MTVKPPLVVINGWAMPASVWGDMRDWLSERFALTWVDINCSRTSEQWLEFLAANCPPSAIWLGWSLGGELALEVAKQNVLPMRRLILLASTPCFMARPDWPCGQPQSAVDKLRSLVQKSSASLIKRFALLQTVGSIGEQVDTRKMLSLIDQHDPVFAKDTLLSGLALLEQLDSRAWLQRAGIPVDFILGESDSVVLVKKDELIALNPQINANVIPGMGHFPFLSSALSLKHCLQELFDGPTGRRL